jgi:hypothetical protein
MYMVVASREFWTVTSRYATLIDGWASEGGFGFKLSSPAGISTADFTALFVTLGLIGEVI